MSRVTCRIISECHCYSTLILSSQSLSSQLVHLLDPVCVLSKHLGDASKKILKLIWLRLSGLSDFKMFYNVSKLSFPYFLKRPSGTVQWSQCTPSCNSATCCHPWCWVSNCVKLGDIVTMNVPGIRVVTIPWSWARIHMRRGVATSMSITPQLQPWCLPGNLTPTAFNKRIGNVTSRRH